MNSDRRQCDKDKYEKSELIRYKSLYLKNKTRGLKKG